MGSMIKSRRTMRVYSREAGPFVPQGSGLSGPSTMSFSVQANPDELLDFSTLRLRFDYRTLFNGKLSDFFRVSRNFTGTWQGYNDDGGNPNFLSGVLGTYSDLPYLNWLDDGATSLLANARVRLNGQLLEDIAQFNILDHFLIYFTASRDWMFTNGMMAGYYMDYMAEHPSQAVAGTPFNMQFYASDVAADYPMPVKQATLGATFTIPLCGLGIGRSKKFWPVLGSVLTLEFDLETWERCHAMTTSFSGGAGYTIAPGNSENYLSWIPTNFYNQVVNITNPAGGNNIVPFPTTNLTGGNNWLVVPSLLSNFQPYTPDKNLTGITPIYYSFQRGGYQLSNAQIWVDALCADSSLTDALQKLLTKESVGYSVPYESFEVVRYDMSQVGIAPGNTLDLRGRVTAQDLTSITALFRDQVKSSDFTIPNKTATFEFPYLRWSNWVVGGQQYPAFQTGVTEASASACAFNTDTMTSRNTLWSNTSYQNNFGLLDPSLMLTSGSTEWFALTRESLGLGNTNDPSHVGLGLVNPYTFTGRTAYSANGTLNFRIGSAYTNESDLHGVEAFLQNTLPPRFALGQSLEITTGSHSGVDTMNSSNEFVLRIAIDGNGDLTNVLQYQVWEVLFLCRFNAAVVFAGGSMSVRR